MLCENILIKDLIDEYARYRSIGEKAMTRY